MTDPAFRCVHRGDTPPPKEWKSECTSNDNNWYVYVGAGVPVRWSDDFFDSMALDYSPTDINVNWQLSLNTNTDAYVFSTRLLETDPYGLYTTCNRAQFVDEGGGNGYYRWCRFHYIIFDVDHLWTQERDTVEGRDWLSCHELGHTLGLQHYANIDAANGSCMSYHKFPRYVVLKDHDIEHLNDCYPAPTPPQTALTQTCAEFGI